jgi:L-2-hydroxyglutarate oxidase LhgO
VSRDFDVVVIGAGVIGATMAALLGARRLAGAGRVALIADAAAAPATGCARRGER